MTVDTIAYGWVAADMEAAEQSRSRAAVDGLHAAGLLLLEPVARVADEVRCGCTNCGTVRHVRAANVKRSGGVACRWCHGAAKWGPWGAMERERTAQWREVRGAAWVLEQLHAMGLAPLTPIGDEFDVVGVLCEVCGETVVVLPERLAPDRGWNGCERCSADRQRQVRDNAPALFADHGLTLDGPCRGEFAPQRAVCISCGTPRQVSYRALVDGAAPLCWVCTHGIRIDEPHRIYLVRFAQLHAWKVGITHARHDRRLADHTLNGGVVEQVITVPNRAAARHVERQVLATYAPWQTTTFGVEELPQGGWTETWVDHPDAPRCDLDQFAAAPP